MGKKTNKNQDDYWEFSNRLKALRHKKGLTQEDIAAQMNIASNTYSKYENNSCPSMMNIISLAEALSVSIDYLLTGKEFSNQSEILTAFDDCPPEKLPYVLKAIRAIIESYN